MNLARMFHIWTSSESDIQTKEHHWVGSLEYHLVVYRSTSIGFHDLRKRSDETSTILSVGIAQLAKPSTRGLNIMR